MNFEYYFVNRYFNDKFVSGVAGKPFHGKIEGYNSSDLLVYYLQFSISPLLLISDLTFLKKQISEQPFYNTFGVDPHQYMVAIDFINKFLDDFSYNKKGFVVKFTTDMDFLESVFIVPDFTSNVIIYIADKLFYLLQDSRILDFSRC